jgi:hypothetical protein
MRLGSTVESAWRIARDALIRLEHLLVDAGNSGEDLVFHVRRSQNDERIADWVERTYASKAIGLTRSHATRRLARARSLVDGGPPTR